MNTIAALSVTIGILSSLIIAIDLLKHKQSMPIMNSVWILTGLWAGILALIAYFWFGRESNKSMEMEGMEMEGMEMEGMEMEGMEMEGMKMGSMKMEGMKMPKHSKWQSTTLSTLHCGAGCTLADIIGEWFLYLTAITICGSFILGSVVIDYILALCIGIFFQASAIKSMNKTMHPITRFKTAFKADVLSLTSWQIGMYAFMALALLVIFPHNHIERTSWLFWFMMQISMLVGFFFAYPANVILIKLGIKKAM